MFDLTSIDVSLAGWVFANYGAMLAICLIGCTPLIHRANAALSARFSWFVWVKPFVYTALMKMCIRDRYCNYRRVVYNSRIKTVNRRSNPEKVASERCV